MHKKSTPKVKKDSRDFSRNGIFSTIFTFTGCFFGRKAHFPSICAEIMPLRTVLGKQKNDVFKHVVFCWRRHPDLNRGSRICSPMPYHLAMAPRRQNGHAPYPLPRSSSTKQSCGFVLFGTNFRSLFGKVETRLWNGKSVFRRGAGDEIRTRYLHLGKVALCQMSYARKWCLRSESNQRHADFQSAALPTELQRHMVQTKWWEQQGSNL